MRVKVFREGCDSGAREYDADPFEAARKFCEDNRDEMLLRCEINLIVVPLDDEARALPGWHSDEEDPAFKMFVVEPTMSVIWTRREVDTLNPYQKTNKE